MHIKLLGILILGHLTVDLVQGGLPSILPLLQDRLGLTYAAVGGILTALNLTSSVVQPLFGYLSDRFPLVRMLPFSILVSGIGIACLSLAESYLAVLGLVVISGLGVASYHPLAFALTGAAGGERKATVMSWFVVGGNLGSALGPLFLTLCFALAAWQGLWFFALPAVILSLALIFTGATQKQLQTTAKAQKPAPQPIGKRLKPYSVLVGALTLRSMTNAGIMTMVPFFFIHVLGGPPEQVGLLLFNYLIFGVMGTLVGGVLADKLGHKLSFVLSGVLACPALLMMLFADSFWIYACLAWAGFALQSAWAVAVVMGQQILPDRAALSSGMLMGVSHGLAGIAASLLGVVADFWGLYIVMGFIVLFTILSTILAINISLPPISAGAATSSLKPAEKM